MVAFSILMQALSLMELSKVTIEKEGDYHVKQALQAK